MTGKRVFGLDVLRAIAILLVVLGHGMQLLPSLSSMANFADKFFYLGVEIFFVLSGFLITYLLVFEKIDNKDSARIEAFDKMILNFNEEMKSKNSTNNTKNTKELK